MLVSLFRSEVCISIRGETTFTLVGLNDIVGLTIEADTTRSCDRYIASSKIPFSAESPKMTYNFQTKILLNFLLVIIKLCFNV